MRLRSSLLFFLTACSQAGPGASAENGLEGATSVHVVSVAGWGGVEQPVPDTVSTTPGAAVVFQIADFRVHTVHFLTDEMTPAQAGFMEENRQVLSPPLTERGSRYIVRFDEAPPGTYPFRVEGFGDPAEGAIVVGTGGN